MSEEEQVSTLHNFFLSKYSFLGWDLALLICEVFW
jgi:hypothetical protein